MFTTIRFIYFQNYFFSKLCIITQIISRKNKTIKNVSIYSQRENASLFFEINKIN